MRRQERTSVARLLLAEVAWRCLARNGKVRDSRSQRGRGLGRKSARGTGSERRGRGNDLSESRLGRENRGGGDLIPHPEFLLRRVIKQRR